MHSRINFIVSLDIHADYSLEDGVLTHYSARVINMTSGGIYQSVSANRIGFDSEDLNVVAEYPSNTTTTTVGPPAGIDSSNLTLSALSIISLGVLSTVVLVIILDYRRVRSL